MYIYARPYILSKLFHLIGCTSLILHNFYLELCVLVEKINITEKNYFIMYNED
jgi:hypothetical protein